MSKAILISIKPNWVALELNEIKKVEVRSSATKEWKDYLNGKIKEMPKPIDVYIYCTKDIKQSLYWNGLRWVAIPQMNEIESIRSGKVVAKFTLNKVEEIKPIHDKYISDNTYYATQSLNQDNLQKLSCLSYEELKNYLKDKKGYAWNISNLEIFDRPRELSEFKQKWYCKNLKEYLLHPIGKAPQSWCYVENL